MKLAVSNTTATAIAFVASDIELGAVSIEIQISTAPDFMWALAPVLPYQAVTTAQQISGLNQASRYYLRSRPVFGGNIRGTWSRKIAAFTPVASNRNLAPAAVMIEPVIIVPPEPVLEWVGAGDVDGHPARCLGRDDPNSVWMCRTFQNIAAFQIEHSGAPIDTIAVLETNAPEGSTFAVRAANSPELLTSNPAYSYGPIPFRASPDLPQRRGFHGLMRLPAPQQYRFWRIEIIGAPAGGIFCATYAILGTARITKNFSVDSRTEVLVDAGSVDRDRSGNPSRIDGFRARAVDFDIEQMTEREYETQYQDLRWLVGVTEPCLVVPNSKRGAFLHDRILYGQMTAQPVTQGYAPRMTQKFRVNSLI